MATTGFLLLTDSERLAGRVRELLAVEGFTDVHVCEPVQVAQRTDLGEPELVLVEVPGGREGAMELARTLKERFESDFVPIVALVTGSTGSIVAEVLAAGVDDAVAMPEDENELGVRVRLMMRAKRRYDELTLANRRLMELSSRDELTGLHNRRYFFECLAIEFERGIRYQQPLSCIMIDLDEFKPINDNYGHLVGDALFKKAAAMFRSIPRKVDVVARYGGDEVVILLPATGLDAAVAMAGRLCDTMAASTFRISGREIVMTISAGVAMMDPENPTTSDELLTRADMALYAAKRAGRNNVQVWSAELEKDRPDELPTDGSDDVSVEEPS